MIAPDVYTTRPVEEELQRLEQYLTTQSDGLQVSIDSPVPIERYVIPQSLVLIVQNAQRYHRLPLHVSIRFLKHTIEVSHPVQPLPTPDETHPDLQVLVDLYRIYYNFPTVRQTDNEFTVSIPLFI